jgi:hypothetical protein
MKIVINRCYGGFSLSAEAVAALAKLNGRECYFFSGGIGPSDPYKPVSLDEAGQSLFVTAFDEYVPPDPKSDSFNEWYTVHCLDCHPDARTDPKLVEVVETLGTARASGRHAVLEVVEIPDGVEWEISDYDGIEHVHEVHRIWP